MMKMQLHIDRYGYIDHEKITLKIFSNIERGDMKKVVGLVVHQTGGITIQSTFDSYRQKGANGAHFLIDKEGKIYQTVSLFKKTNHVGMIQSRCYIEKTCPLLSLRKSLN